MKLSRKILCLILVVSMIIPSLAINIVAESTNAGFSVTNPQTEYTTNPIGIDVTTPRFSWQMESDVRGAMQVAYQIGVSSSLDNLEKGIFDVWESEKVVSDISVGIEYGGPTLESTLRYYWDVTVWGNDGGQASFTEKPYFEMGILSRELWDAKWIDLPIEEDNANLPTKYTIETDFRIVEDAAGLIFAAKDGSNFLMWQINVQEHEFGGPASFRPHQWVNGGGSVISGQAHTIENIIPKEAFFTPHHMKIVVDGTQITTFIDDVQINQMNSPYAGFGKLGFRQNFNAGNNDEQAAFDNMKVTDDSTGEILFSDDFNSGINKSFSVGEVIEGELFVENALGLQNSIVGEGAPMYRKDFEVPSKIKRARLYATALGLYEFSINGTRVGKDYFNPGWTSYDYNESGQNYVMYQTYDVTDMLDQGTNTMGAITGHGWYSGKLFVVDNNKYGKGSKLFAQMIIEYEDGSKVVIPTDTSWKGTFSGPIIADDFQGGETYDANLEIPGWDKPSFEINSKWKSVKEFTYPGGIIAQIGPTVQVTDEMPAKARTSPKEGTYIFDIEQNMVGWVRLLVNGNKGDVVKLRFGEMLNSDGTLYTTNLRTAAATDYYILKGEGDEVYEPRFTFHGFRYVEVTGYPGVPELDDITGIVCSSLQEFDGNFETSNDLVNQLQSNIVWGQKGNFISVPTDCPQRDERLGYSGDGQVFVRTAAMNMDTNQFFKKFMLDLSSNQRNDGAIADWAPNFVPTGSGWGGSYGNAGWGDAIVIMPWTVYTTYGDVQILEDNYEAMKGLLRYYDSLTNNDFIVPTCAYGDWLSVGADTPKNVVATGYYAYCADLVSKIAKILDKPAEAEHYAELFTNIRTAFNDKFVTEDGRVSGNTQTSYLFALKFELLETQEMREKVAKHLVDDIEAKNWHLSTGFLGVSYLCPMLSDMGYSDVAYRILLQESYPSWFYSIKGGATTIWERWNSYIHETGEMGDAGMNSFNHYSLGSVGEWLYRYVSGIEYDENSPGFKNFILQPTPGGNLTYANGSFDSVYGEIISNWKFDESGNLAYEAFIPANTTAKIYLPATSADGVFESGIDAREADGLTFIGMENGKAVFEAVSGHYFFTTDSKIRYTLQINASNSTIFGAVKINGEQIQRLPASVSGMQGETITIEPVCINDVDYKFDSWSEDVNSKDANLSITLEGNMSITMNQVYSGYKNIAVGTSASASETDGSAPSWTPANLTDGILISMDGKSNGYTSRSKPKAGGQDISSNPIWMQIDLGENMDFDRVQIYPRTDTLTIDGKTAAFPQSFTIQIRKTVSDEWETVHTATDVVAPFLAPYVASIGEVKNARYVRVNVTKVGELLSDDQNSYRIQIAEIGIYNTTTETREGIFLTSDPSHDNITAFLENYTDDILDATVAIAVYNLDGALVDYYLEDVSVGVGLSATVQTYPDVSSARHDYKVFAWNSNFEPLTDFDSGSFQLPH